MAKDIADVLRARRIEVVDEHGRVRAVLSVVRHTDFDSVSLGLFDPAGGERVSVQCDGQVAGVELWEQGNAVAALRSNRDGDAALTLADPETGEPVAGLSNEAA